MIDRSRDSLIADALRGSLTAVFFQNTNGEFTWVENPQSGWNESAVIGLKDSDIFEPDTAASIKIAKAEARELGGTTTIDVRVQNPLEESVQWFKLTYKYCELDGASSGFLGTATEITGELQRAETLNSLLREVSHRSKNMLSIVLSLAAQTARRSGSKDAFMRSFTGRVQSLAKSQDVIVAQDWSGASLEELVDRQVRNILPRIPGQIMLEGDTVSLSPNGATHVGLALHELCTNALTHGALADPKGKIVISGEVLEGDSGAARLTWREGPVNVSEGNPKDSTFGRTVLERVVPAAVGGEAKLTLEGKEVVYELTIGQGDVATTHY